MSAPPPFLHPLPRHTMIGPALQQQLQLVVKALLARSPAYLWRVLRVAFSPSLILRKLALVSLLQLLAYALKLLLRAQRHNPLTGDRSARSMASAVTYEDWEKAHHDQPPQQLAPLPPELQLYCRMLDEGADNYMRLMASGDMHALMFRLRSELMRGAAGGNGYNRDGNVTFRKHREPTYYGYWLSSLTLTLTLRLYLLGGVPQAPLRPQPHQPLPV